MGGKRSLALVALCVLLTRVLYDPPMRLEILAGLLQKGQPVRIVATHLRIVDHAQQAVAEPPIVVSFLIQSDLRPPRMTRVLLINMDEPRVRQVG